MKQNTNKKDLFGKSNTDNEITKGIKIGVVVVLVLVLVYLLTAFLTGEIKFGNKKKDTTTPSTIQYEEIIAGQILNRIEEDYYVLAFNFTDDNAGYYLTLKNSYLQNNDAVSFYILDLEKGFNQSILTEKGKEYSEKPESISELKVESPTLLKVSKGKIIERTTGEEKVTEKLEKIAN